MFPWCKSFSGLLFWECLLRLWPNGWNCTDDIFKCILINDNFWISNKNFTEIYSLKSTESAFYQLMAWWWTKTSCHLKQRLLNYLTPYGFSRPQWVKLSNVEWPSGPSELGQGPIDEITKINTLRPRQNVLHFKFEIFMVLNRLQTIIWTSDGLVCWCIQRSLDLNGLMYRALHRIIEITK